MPRDAGDATRCHEMPRDASMQICLATPPEASGGDSLVLALNEKAKALDNPISAVFNKSGMYGGELCLRFFDGAIPERCDDRRLIILVIDMLPGHCKIYQELVKLGFVVVQTGALCTPEIQPGKFSTPNFHKRSLQLSPLVQSERAALSRFRQKRL